MTPGGLPQDVHVHAGDMEVIGKLGKGRYSTVSSVMVDASTLGSGKILRGQMALKTSWGDFDADIELSAQRWALEQEISILSTMGPHQNVISAKGRAVSYRAHREGSVGFHTFGILLEEMAGGCVQSLIEYVLPHDLMPGKLPHGKGFAPYEVLVIMVQTVAGVWHAHKQGYIHRDLKADNLFLSGHLPRTASDLLPRLVVADWGIALKLLQDVMQVAPT
ncbi:hypothetical protein WJX73_008245 [Symbiochloris irregularis]|uniref:Protein kinase domain-containing protein n=1 Tax=Symbiochloris irregularis TaxID=706552 RepID=A0AAW1PYS5_9CHLO